MVLRIWGKKTPGQGLEEPTQSGRTHFHYYASSELDDDY
jgi:hypothetical protein